MAAKPAPFQAMPVKATTRAPAAPGPKMAKAAPGAGAAPGAKVNPFATKTSGPAFKKGGMSKGGKC